MIHLYKKNTYIPLTTQQQVIYSYTHTKKQGKQKTKINPRDL